MSDINKLTPEQVANIAKAVEGEVHKKVTADIVQKLSPTAVKPAPDPIHEQFVHHPKEFLNNFAQGIKEATLKEVETKTHLANQMKADLAPIYDEYPDLQRVPNELFADFAATDEKKSTAERLKDAATRTAERLKFKSKAEAQKEEELRQAAGIPSGYRQMPAQADPKKISDARAFYASRKEAFQKMTGKQVTNQK